MCLRQVTDCSRIRAPVFLTCNQNLMAAGEFCEGDGECGTLNTLNGCSYLGSANNDWYERIDGLVNVSVRHDDHVVLGTAQGLHTFAMACAGFIKAVGNGRRAYKTDCFDIGVGHQGINGFFVALNHVENTTEQARLVE